MAESSAISWTDSTFNPWIGCAKVSAGCKNCYAAARDHRFGRDDRWGPKGRRERTKPGYWRGPRAWNRIAFETGRRHLVFCGSLCDVFEDHPDANAIRPDLWALIRSTRALTWQLLTKRPENIPAMLPEDWGYGWRQVWLGTSIEDMRVAARADALRAVPARIRFVSYEPALGPIDGLDLQGIDWLIAGGESGRGFRPANPDWFRGVRDRCTAAGVAFFFKQSSAVKPGQGALLDGRPHHEWPPEVVDRA